jgi:hypothetical protein
MLEAWEEMNDIGEQSLDIYLTEAWISARPAAKQGSNYTGAAAYPVGLMWTHYTWTGYVIHERLDVWKE